MAHPMNSPYQVLPLSREQFETMFPGYCPVTHERLGSSAMLAKPARVQRFQKPEHEHYSWPLL